MRSALDTRNSRPPASTIVASEAAIPAEFYDNDSPRGKAGRTAALDFFRRQNGAATA